MYVNGRYGYYMCKKHTLFYYYHWPYDCGCALSWLAAATAAGAGFGLRDNVDNSEDDQKDGTAGNGY